MEAVTAAGAAAHGMQEGVYGRFEQCEQETAQVDAYQ